MKQSIEKFPAEKQLNSNEKLGALIRAKIKQGLTLTPREEAFLAQQIEDNRQDDNPRYGH